jgi:hypothetical protein
MCDESSSYPSAFGLSAVREERAEALRVAALRGGVSCAVQGAGAARPGDVDPGGSALGSPVDRARRRWSPMPPPRRAAGRRSGRGRAGARVASAKRRFSDALEAAPPSGGGLRADDHASKAVSSSKWRLCPRWEAASSRPLVSKQPSMNRHMEYAFHRSMPTASCTAIVAQSFGSGSRPGEAPADRICPERTATQRSQSTVLVVLPERANHASTTCEVFCRVPRGSDLARRGALHRGEGTRDRSTPSNT